MFNWLNSRPLWLSIPLHIVGFIVLVGGACVLGQALAFGGQALHENANPSSRESRTSAVKNSIARPLCFIGGLPVGAVCGGVVGLYIAGWILGRDAAMFGAIVGAPIGALYGGIRYAKNWAKDLGSTDLE
jgi:hypothetical protein